MSTETFSSLMDSLSSDDDQMLATHDKLFLHANEISQFLKIHSQDLEADECFQKLQSFFDIFTEQLRINFELRNNLSKMKKHNNIDIGKVYQTKKGVNEFLDCFNKMTNQDAKSISDTTNFIIQALSSNHQNSILYEENQRLCRVVKSRYEDYISVKSKLENIEKDMKEKLDSLENETKSIRSRISRTKTSIKNLGELISSLSIRVHEKEEKRKQLLQDVEEKQAYIADFKANYEMRNKSLIQENEKLETILSKLKIEKQQLENNEKPLAKALDEAENELASVEKAAKNEIENINSDIKKIDVMIKENQNNLKKETERNDSLLHEKTEIQEQLDKENQQGKNNQNQIVTIQDSLSELEKLRLSFILGSTSEDQEEAMVREAADTEKRCLILENEIEELRKSIHKLKSLIRINKTEILTPASDYKKMKEVSETQIEQLRHLTEQISSEQEKYNVYKRSIESFNQLKEKLGLNLNTSPKEVVKNAIAICSEEPLLSIDSTQPSSSTIQEDFDWLSDQIHLIQTKLNYQ